MTKEEIIRENSKNINVTVGETKKEFIKDARKEFSDMLKKTFRDSKHVRIK